MSKRRRMLQLIAMFVAYEHGGCPMTIPLCTEALGLIEEYGMDIDVYTYDGIWCHRLELEEIMVTPLTNVYGADYYLP